MVYIGFESATTQDDNLSEGCRLCTLGAKMVLFVTGVCPRSCFYCPLTSEKASSPIMANEREVHSDSDVIEEARSMDALGTGITGGEPLLRLADVLHYIRVLKNEFTDIHHIHLYTSQAPSYEVLDSLATAGLDEIRFHPPMSVWDSISDSPYRRCMEDALKFGMDVGIEIPAIRNVPAIVALIDELGCFLNLNELEFTEANAASLKKIGYRISEDSNAAIGSSDIARTIIEGTEAQVHFCPSAFKDAVQLRERLKRKAKAYARPFDEITPDGTIVYGCICCMGCIDCGGYEDAKNTDEAITGCIALMEEMDVPHEMYCIENSVVHTQWQVAEWLASNFKNIGCSIAIIEQYPMKNGMIVEESPL